MISMNKLTTYIPIFTCKLKATFTESGKPIETSPSTLWKPIKEMKREHGLHFTLSHEMKKDKKTLHPSTTLHPRHPNKKGNFKS